MQLEAHKRTSLINQSINRMKLAFEFQNVCCRNCVGGSSRQCCKFWGNFVKSTRNWILQHSRQPVTSYMSRNCNYVNIIRIRRNAMAIIRLPTVPVIHPTIQIMSTKQWNANINSNAIYEILMGNLLSHYNSTSFHLISMVKITMHQRITPHRIAMDITGNYINRMPLSFEFRPVLRRRIGTIGAAPTKRNEKRKEKK